MGWGVVFMIVSVVVLFYFSFLLSVAFLSCCPEYPLGRQNVKNVKNNNNPKQQQKSPENQTKNHTAARNARITTHGTLFAVNYHPWHFVCCAWVLFYVPPPHHPSFSVSLSLEYITVLTMKHYRTVTKAVWTQGA